MRKKNLVHKNGKGRFWHARNRPTISIMLVPIIILLILCTNVSAVMLDYLNTEIKLGNDGSARVKVSFSIDTTYIDGVMIPIRDVHVVNVNDGDYNLRYAWVDSGLLVKAEKHRPGYPVHLEYITTRFTSKSDDRWSIVYEPVVSGEFRLKENSKTAVLLSLPRDSVLVSFEPEGLIFTEKNLLKIGWKIESSNSSYIRADYRTSINASGEELRKELIESLMLLLLTSVLLLIAGRWFFNHYIKKISPGKRMIIDTLEEREALIVKFLIENLNSKKKEITQSQLQKQTNISKATVSRTVKRLKEKGIITIRPLGTTNLIQFSKGFLKK